MRDKEWSPETIFDVFGDPLCRQVLVVAAESPVSATELAERLDVSPPTVYRRTDALTRYDLVSEHNRVNENGNHFRLFRTRFRGVQFEIEDGGYTVDVRMREPSTSQFESFWDELSEASPDGGSTARDGPIDSRSNEDGSPL